METAARSTLLGQSYAVVIAAVYGFVLSCSNTNKALHDIDVIWRGTYVALKP